MTMCPHGHDIDVVGFYVERRPERKLAKEYRRCAQCGRDRYYRGLPAGPRRRRYKWSEVEDTLDLCKVLYEAPRVVEQAARGLGVHPHVVELHIKRRGWTL